MDRYTEGLSGGGYNFGPPQPHHNIFKPAPPPNMKHIRRFLDGACNEWVWLGLVAAAAVTLITLLILSQWDS